MIYWNKKLEIVTRHITYIDCLLNEGDLVGTSLHSCKALDMLMPEDAELKKDLDCCREFCLFVEKTTGDAIFPKDKHFATLHKLLFSLHKYNAIVPSKEGYARSEKLLFFNPHPDIRNVDYSSESTAIKRRNRIIHSHTDFGSEKFLFDSEQLAMSLVKLPFVAQKLRVQNVRSYELKRKIEYDLGLRRDVDTCGINPKKSIERKHFENLTLARNEIFPQLAMRLEKELGANKKISKYLDTANIQVSSTDSTSAYIWLAIPLKVKNKLDHDYSYPAQYAGREKIVLPSLSIVMTPVELLCYVEFAGMSFFYKNEYYKFVLSNAFSKLIEAMVKCKTKVSIKGTPCLRDVHWYVFENNRELIASFIGEDKKQNLKSYKRELRAKLNDRKDEYCEAVTSPKKGIITWNYALPGWVDDFQSVIESDISIETYSKLIGQRASAFAILFEHLSSFSKVDWPTNREQRLKNATSFLEMLGHKQ